jgi:hypothetical protein
MTKRAIGDQSEKLPTLPHATVLPLMAKVHVLGFLHFTMQLLALVQLVTEFSVSKPVDLLSYGGKKLCHPTSIGNVSSAHPRKRNLLVLLEGERLQLGGPGLVLQDEHHLRPRQIIAQQQVVLVF